MNYIKRKGWKKVPQSRPRELGKTIMKTKCVLKKKEQPDGIICFKMQCVSKGFQQTPGIDFTESFVPVANDTSIQVGIGVALYSKAWTIEVIDIEAAFLEGEITEPTFIHFPEGMQQFGFIQEGKRDQYCIELKKSIYGNVNAALKFFQTYSTHLINTHGSA